MKIISTGKSNIQNKLSKVYLPETDNLSLIFETSHATRSCGHSTSMSTQDKTPFKIKDILFSFFDGLFFIENSFLAARHRKKWWGERDRGREKTAGARERESRGKKDVEMEEGIVRQKKEEYKDTARQRECGGGSDSDGRLLIVKERI